MKGSRIHQHLIPATAQALQLWGHMRAHPISAPTYIHASRDMHGDIAAVDPLLQDSGNITALNGLSSPKVSPMVTMARWFSSVSPALLDNITARWGLQSPHVVSPQHWSETRGEQKVSRHSHHKVGVTGKVTAQGYTCQGQPLAHRPALPEGFFPT